MLGVSIVFLLLAIAGSIQFKANEILGNVRLGANSTILDLNDGWTYETKDGMSFSTSNRFSKNSYIFMAIHGGLYVVGALLQLT